MQTYRNPSGTTVTVQTVPFGGFRCTSSDPRFRGLFGDGDRLRGYLNAAGYREVAERPAPVAVTLPTAVQQAEAIALAARTKRVRQVGCKMVGATLRGFGGGR